MNGYGLTAWSRDSGRDVNDRRVDGGVRDRNGEDGRQRRRANNQLSKNTVVLLRPRELRRMKTLDLDIDGDGEGED